MQARIPTAVVWMEQQRCTPRLRMQGNDPVLLRAKANPLLRKTSHESGVTSDPLDMDIRKRHSEVARELLQQVGLDGCGGACRGVQAFSLAAIVGRPVDTLAALTQAGVVDNGMALAAAAANRRDLSLKFLLQQMKGDDVAAYVNSRDNHGNTPVLYAVGSGGIFFSPSPRILRLLVDAGADTTSAVRVRNTANETPLALVPLCSARRNIRKGRHGGAATQAGGHPAPVVAGRSNSCGLVPVAGCIPSMIANTRGTSRTVATSTP